MRKLRYVTEAAGFILIMGMFRLLPLDTSSWLGGAVMKRIGPRLKIAEVARTNISFAFPDKKKAECEKILVAHFEHLGRVVAEFAHLPGNSLYSRLSLKGAINLPPEGESAIFVSGHYGNWEMLAAMACENGLPLTLIYRHANNPLVDKLIYKMRATHAGALFPKGLKGAPKMARALKNGESLAMLIDQKMNEGIPVQLFGKNAMTAPAVAQLALRFDMPIIPARVVRTKGAHFSAEIFKPLTIKRTGNDEQDIRRILMDLHAMIESWIYEHPEQWLWVHRRFDKSEYKMKAPVTTPRQILTA